MAEGRPRKSGFKLVRVLHLIVRDIVLIRWRCSLVPVVAIGFDDLQKRVEAQTQQAAAHQERLKVRCAHGFFIEVE